jgi:hypothetical protein
MHKYYTFFFFFLYLTYERPLARSKSDLFPKMRLCHWAALNMYGFEIMEMNEARIRILEERK